MAQASTLTDLDHLALSMPQVERDPTGPRASYRLRTKSFIVARTPRKDAVDPQGQRLTDVLMFRCCGPEDKAAILDHPGTPFFTTPHFEGYNAVLLQESRLGEVPVDELAEIVADAWLAVAPSRVATTWLAARGLLG